MTLDQMASYIGSKVGQTDTTSLGLIKGFIQRRYQMVIDAHPWRDAQVPATATATAGVADVNLPGSMDRVYAIRANGRFLEPVSSMFMIETDPTAFERSGEPKYYEEWTDVSTKKIKLFPVPAVSTALYIVGRRALPALTAGTDVPIIRNIDNALIAYATGDMLERQRQYGKAQAKLQEANAMLEAAKALETQQTNQPRRAKGLTVAGNSLAEMADAVAARCDAWAPDHAIFIRDCIRRNYQNVYNSQLWQESTILATVASDGEQIVLPEYINRVIALRADAGLGALIPTDVGYLLGIAPQIFEQTTGTQFSFSYLPPVAVKVLMTGHEKLSIFSSSVDDKGNVFVRGYNAGALLEETIALNGTTPVETANEYDTPVTISKLPSLGDVTIKGATSTVEFQRLRARETERKHIRLLLTNPNTTGRDCLVLGKQAITPLVADEDTPAIRDIQSVLIDLSVSDMFSKAGNGAAAAEARAKADAALQDLLAMEQQQGASQPRIVPSAEPMNYDACLSSGGWLSK